ncbi:unnamed protein product, partial [Medioppia subpectinata]
QTNCLFVSIGKYPNYTKFGVNEDSCGYRFSTEVMFTTYKTNCFRNNYSPRKLHDVNGQYDYPHLLSTSRLTGGWHQNYGEGPWAVSVKIVDSWPNPDAGSRVSWKKTKSIITYCSGVLITTKWVLTAADCFRNVHKGNTRKTSVSAGYRRKSERLVAVNGIVVKSGVALVRLKKNMLSHNVGRQMLVNTVCLPDLGQVLDRPEWATLFGYGFTDSRSTANDYLHHGDIYLLSRNTCNPLTNDTLLCSSNSVGHNISIPCIGDEGSPVVQYTDKYRTKAILVGTHVRRGPHADDPCQIIFVNGLRKCGHNRRVDEVMATEDNDSQTWHQINQITHKDMDCIEMITKLNEMKIFSETIDKMQCILDTNSSDLCENIQSLNKTIIDCKPIKISVNLMAINKTINKNNDKFRCLRTDCHFKTQFKSVLIQHQIIHTNIRQFKCDFNDCTKSYKWKSQLIKHKNAVHLNKRFVCDFKDCNKSFTTKQTLFQHKSCVHLNEKDYKYNEENCGKSFDGISDLIRHKRIHSGENPFECDLNNCHKGFTHKSQLIEHKNCVHLNKKPFICNEKNCGKRFTTKHNLFQHKSCVHLNEKLFKCTEENCGKSFGQKSHLIRHKRIHSGEKLYKCDFNDCGKCFAQKSQLIEHKNCVHLNKKLFKCNEKNCGKYFSRKPYLICHKRIHSGEKPYKCDFNDCIKCFTQISHLYRHKRGSMK